MEHNASEEYINDLQMSHNLLMTDSLVQLLGSEEKFAARKFRSLSFQANSSSFEL